MKGPFAAVVFILFSAFNLQTSYAEPETIYIDFQKVYLPPHAPGTETATLNSLNPASYSVDLLLNDGNKGVSFFLPNLGIEIEDITSPGENLLKSKSLSVKSGFAPSESLKLSGKFKIAVAESLDLEADHLTQRDPLIKIERAQGDFNGLFPRLFTYHGEPGFFFNLNCQPWKWISVNVYIDKNWRDTGGVKNGPVSINHGLFKTSLSPSKFMSLVTGIEVHDVNSQKSDNLHTTTFAYFGQLNSRWKNYETSVRYRVENLDDREDPGRGFNADELTVEIKKTWARNEVRAKGGVSHKKTQAGESKHFAVLGFTYNPFNGLKLQLNNSYERFGPDKDKKDQIKLSGEINFKLPFNVQFRNSLKINKTIDGDANYEFMASIVMKLNS